MSLTWRTNPSKFHLYFFPTTILPVLSQHHSSNRFLVFHSRQYTIIIIIQCSGGGFEFRFFHKHFNQVINLLLFFCCQWVVIVTPSFDTKNWKKNIYSMFVESASIYIYTLRVSGIQDTVSSHKEWPFSVNLRTSCHAATYMCRRCLGLSCHSWWPWTPVFLWYRISKPIPNVWRHTT